MQCYSLKRKKEEQEKGGVIHLHIMLGIFFNINLNFLFYNDNPFMAGIFNL